MSIKSHKPNKRSMFKQGYIERSLCEKYVGNGPIIYRSSWEYKFALWCEQNPNVEAWNSEGLCIPYISSVDKREHKYYPDFYVKLGNGTHLIVEIKPKKDLHRPEPPRRQTLQTLERYKKSLETYKMNLSKWKFAKKYAKERGAKFIIVTEDFFNK